ncbi:MAG: SdrD B-like domain-containing protein [Acidimicrobiales bacterium]
MRTTSWRAIAVVGAACVAAGVLANVGVADAASPWNSGTGVIGNRVWSDLDRDGIQDATEPGLPDRTVTLYSEDLQLLARGTTGPGGWWGYTNLALGRCYVVEIGRVAGDVFTYPQQGTETARDSDADASGRMKVCVSPSSPTRNDIDAGVYSSLPKWQNGTAQIGNRVWNDVDRDGIQDSNEPGIEGARIGIDRLDSGDDMDAVGLTGPGGWFGFSQLSAGCYRIVIPYPELGGPVPTLQRKGTDSTRDSDIGPQRSTQDVCVTAGEVRTDIDVGLHSLQPATDPDRLALPQLTGVASVSAGGDVTCATMVNTQVRCWGENAAGELAREPENVQESSLPLLIDGVRATGASAGLGSACAALTDGGASCWGLFPSWGFTDPMPKRLDNLTLVTSVTGGLFGGCARRMDSTASCWGFSWEGQLGDGGPVSPGEGSWRGPGAVVALGDAAKVSRRANHTCALRSSGAVACWGGGVEGQLGRGTNVPASSPANVVGIADAVDVATNYLTSCAARRDGSVWCWGYGRNGLLGSATEFDSPVPVKVAGVAGATSVGMGVGFACALRGADGSVVCWGDEASRGQRGDGTTTANPQPTKVVLNERAISLSVGQSHACVVTTRQTVKCWGSNLRGALGDASGVDRATPVDVLTR